MSRFFIKLVLLVVAIAFVVGAIGCQTWKGAGRDVQNLGEKMEGQ